MAKRVDKEIQEINKLRSLFPRNILVQVTREDDGFVADIKMFPGCMTQADSFADLIDMVTDAVRTYFEVPEKYLPFMPSYNPPISEAKRLGAFPINDKKSIQLEISDGQVVKC